MAYTSLAEIERQQKLAAALAQQQYRGNYATNSGAALSGLAGAINQYTAEKASKKATDAQSENERIRQREMQQLTEALAGKTMPPLQEGQMPRFSSPEVQSLAANLELQKALAKNKAQAESQLGSNSPSSVREWEYYNSLPQEDQERYLGMKRGSSPINLGNEYVYPNPVNPSADPVARMPIQPGPTDMPEFIGEQAAARQAGGSGGLNLTPAQQAVDSEFAKQYAEFNAGGGYADVEKNIEQLRSVSKRLEQSDNLTGPFVGNLPTRIREITNPESAAVQQEVEEIVQRNLRIILGAQFTAKEGEQLIARAFNPRLDEETNKRRVDALLRQIETAAQEKLNASRYYEENGTLQGYTGRVPTISDFMGFDFDQAQTAQEAGGLTPAEQAELDQLRARFNGRP